MKHQASTCFPCDDPKCEVCLERAALCIYCLLPWPCPESKEAA
jgi:hypothetical protein